jgi:outer membrane protein assembly complex protein YaeT
MKATDRVTGGGSTPARRHGSTVRPAGAGAASLWSSLPFCLFFCSLCLVSFFLLPVTCPAQAPAEKLIVADVIPQVVPPESQTVPPQKIVSLLKTRPGAEYQPEVVNEDVRSLYETKLFADIRVLTQLTGDRKIIVYFQLKELPGVIQEIIYRGANHMKPDDLEAVTGLRKGVPLNPWATQKARQALLEKYHEKGRLSASVDILEGDKVGDTRVIYHITEGPVAKVSRIDFVGNSSFASQARLRTQVNSSRPFLGLIGGDFNPGMADNDMVKLEEYYRHFGFHDVHVRRELQWDESQRYVKLIFHIHEGRRYRVGDFQVTGVSPEEQKELQPLITPDLHKGDLYDQHKVDVGQEKMKNYIGYKGREAAIQPVVYYPPDRPGEVVVNYEIQERPPARVGQIFISGNEVTKQNVILRQVPLYPGQVLTYPDLRVAERNLAKLNIFEMKPDQGIRPTVTVLDDNDTEFKDLLINVHETQTGSLLFGIGVNSDSGLNGSIVLNERNFDILRPPTSLDELLSGRAFRGAGQEFRIEAVPGTDLQRYTVNFREPFLFDSPYSLSVGAYYWNRIYNEYTEERLGSRITVGRQLNKQWSANVGVRIEDVGVHNVPVFAPFDFQSVAGSGNFLLGLRGGITRDTRDSYLRPTEGSKVEVSFEQVLGNFTFPVLSVEGDKYWTTHQRPDGSGRQVLAARSQMAICGSNAPVFERFYAGGFNSMRGFEFRGVGPAVGGFELGGDFLFLNSVEYQIPLVANDQLYAVAFLDSGTVEPRVELRDYRVAAGVGLRIVVPMLGPVPIALDFGFPIVKADTDKSQVFSFWVGFFH